MKTFASRGSQVGPAVLLALTFSLSLMSTSAAAQDDQTRRSSEYDRNKAVPVRHSRAEMEADRLVSLSADKIVSLLASEPGLFLECKKLLVRTAYAQGRLIDPDDLTDEAVFRQVRQDESTRVLFTREIENRAYVRAKPTLAEQERNSAAPGTPQTVLAGTAGTSVPNPKSQEDLYWSQSQGNVSGLGIPPGNNPTQQAPQQNPSTTLPANDPRRLLLLAQAQSAAGGVGGVGGNAGMSSPSNDQVSQMLSASLTGGAGAPGGTGLSGGLGLGLGEQGSALGQGFGANALMGGGLGMPGLGGGSLTLTPVRKSSSPHQPLPHLRRRPLLQRRSSQP